MMLYVHEWIVKFEPKYLHLSSSAVVINLGKSVFMKVLSIPPGNNQLKKELDHVPNPISKPLSSEKRREKFAHSLGDLDLCLAHGLLLQLLLCPWMCRCHFLVGSNIL